MRRCSTTRMSGQQRRGYVLELQTRVKSGREIVVVGAGYAGSTTARTPETVHPPRGAFLRGQALQCALTMYQVIHARRFGRHRPLTATAHARAQTQVGTSALRVLAAKLSASRRSQPLVVHVRDRFVGVPDSARSHRDLPALLLRPLPPRRSNTKAPTHPLQGVEVSRRSTRQCTSHSRFAAAC
jgi:hypothetical protein